MYESRTEGLISRRRFLLRVLVHLILAALFVSLSLLLGVLGYLWIERDVLWHDAALNMAMIASGIGPTMLPKTIPGKVFLAVYGAYISIVFVAVLGLVLAPIFHRVLHVFHLDDDDDQASSP